MSEKNRPKPGELWVSTTAHPDIPISMYETDRKGWTMSAHIIDLGHGDTVLVLDEIVSSFRMYVRVLYQEKVCDIRDSAFTNGYLKLASPL